MTDHGLDEKAREFAEDLTQTVRSLVPGCAEFEATRLESDTGGDRVWVRQNPDTGIPLRVSGQAILTLKVEYYCCMDSSGEFLAVNKSNVHVFAGEKARGEPLFRYEYVREAAADVPSAHIQLHAHRDAFTHVMGQAGDGTPRGRRRARRADVPRLHEMHFPLGGHRFRPCLEDVLEMLVTELGVDSTPNGRESLRAGREEWRRKQIRAVVRDAPEEAVVALERLGYAVTPPADGSDDKGQPERLRDY